MKKIFIISGEYSGEIHASNVAKALKSITDEIEIEGIGGDNLSNAGVKLFEHIKNLSAVGLSPKIIINHYNLGKRLVEYLTNDYKPDLVLLIDYGGFNLSIAKYLKKNGIKVFYYIPPQVWASRKYRIKRIKKYVDKVLCIFPFEPPMYAQYGIDNVYCGHPLVSQLPSKASRIEFCKKYDLDPKKKLLSVFPGSRVFELKYLMPVFKAFTKKFKQDYPDVQICFSQAPNLSDEIYQKFLKEFDVKVIKGDNHAMLSSSDALVLASGTVALEACLYQTPMLIAYKGPKLFYWIYLLVRCIKRVSLPNIIEDKSIIKELIEDDASCQNIYVEAEKLLFDEEYRKNMIDGLSSVKEKLSSKNSAFEVAKVIDKELFL